MARTVSNLELFLGIALIILGVVLIATRLQIPYVTDAIGVLLVGAGTVFLWRDRLKIVAVGLTLVGVLLLLAHLFQDFGEAAGEVLSIVVGVVLVLFGILVLLGKLRPKSEPAIQAQA